MADEPRTLFVRNGAAHLACQAIGSGPPDLLLVDSWHHHVEAVWDVPDFARFLRRLSALGRLIHFDRRGTGLSDPVPLDALPDLDVQVEDAIAVLDALESEAPVVVGLNDGALVAAMLAATRPERCSSLVLFAATARHEPGGGVIERTVEDTVAGMTSARADDRVPVDLLAPSRQGDPRFADALSRLLRFSIRPGTVGHYYRQTMESDLTPFLPSIRAPVLLLNREGNRMVPADETRRLAAFLPAATVVVLPGRDHLAYSEDPDAVIDEIEEFLTGTRTGADPDRALVTLLFTDIVDSTATAARLGDRRWRDLLAEHDRLVRREVERFGGREIATTGDGFLLGFETPAQALRCADALLARLAAAGMQLRTGVHTGEVDVHGANVGGLAVHIAARVAALAGPGDIYVSSTVRDLLVGSPIRFEERGEHTLKGVPGRWRIFAAFV